MHIDIDTSTKLHISNITNDLFVFLYLFAIRYFLKYKKNNFDHGRFKEVSVFN